MRPSHALLCGSYLSLGIFNAFTALFEACQLVGFVAALAGRGAIFDLALGILGTVITALLSVAYFVMGFVIMRRATVGTLDFSGAMTGWVGLFTLLGINFFGFRLLISISPLLR